MTMVLESREGHLNVPQHGGGQHLVKQGKHVGLGLQTSYSYIATLPSPEPLPTSLSHLISTISQRPHPPNHQHMNLEIKFPTDEI